MTTISTTNLAASNSVGTRGAGRTTLRGRRFTDYILGAKTPMSWSRKITMVKKEKRKNDGDTGKKSNIG